MNEDGRNVPVHFAEQSSLPAAGARMLASLLFADLTPQHYCGMFREPRESAVRDRQSTANSRRTTAALVVILCVAAILAGVVQHNTKVNILNTVPVLAADLFRNTLHFFVSNMPAPAAILYGGIPSLLLAFASLLFAGWLKQRHGLRTGYTRKIFHFLTFTSVVAIHALWGTPGVCLFGAMSSLVVFYAVLRGEGNILYEALAREKDAPHRTHFVLAPYFATLTGGLISNILFGPAAIIGYLVTGLGDAIGEPVGTMFGKHPYRVPSRGGLVTTRTLEGSAAVFTVCLLAITGGLIALNPAIISSYFLLVIPLFAFLCALIEAVSPHGWDNATLQVIPSFVAYLILGQSGL